MRRLSGLSPSDEDLAASDVADGRLFRVGGASALLVVAGYLATFPLYAVVGGPPPAGPEAHLAHYSGHLTGWWGILGLMVGTDLIYLVAWFALFRALRRVHHALGLLSFACAALFVGLDLAVTWPGHAALFVLSDAYRATADATGRASLVTAAAFPVAVMESPLPAIYAILIPSLGPLFAGLAMRRGAFGRGPVVLAYLVGITGVVAVVGPYLSSALGLAHVANALLVTVWLALVGARLVRLGRT